MSETVEPLVKLSEIQGKGRALISSHPIKAGQIIHKDSPLLLYSAQNHVGRSPNCANCFRKLNFAASAAISSCPMCPDHTLFCSPDCKTTALVSSHSQWVCSALYCLRSSSLDSELRTQAAFLIAAYNLAIVSPSNFHILLSLQGDGNLNSETHLLHSFISGVLAHFPLQNLSEFSIELTAALLAKDKLNAFGLMEPLQENGERLVRAYAFYPQASLFNHDCLPNACSHLDFTGVRFVDLHNYLHCLRKGNPILMLVSALFLAFLLPNSDFLSRKHLIFPFFDLIEDHDLLLSAALGDDSNASSNAHVCPYLALHGFPHPAHPTPSNSSETVADSNYFHRHPTGLGGSSSGDLLNSRAFSATEPHHHNWQQPSLPLSVAGGLLNNSEQPTSQMPRLPRSDSNSQQRIGSFMHPLPLLHGSITRTNSNIVGPMVPPILGDSRGPRIRGHSGHIYPQHSAASLPARNAPYAPIRRSGPRTVALVSSMGPNSYADDSRFYGFSMSGSVNRNRQDSEIIGRRFDRVYGWGREGFAPLPWVPVEGESQWWGPLPSNQSPQTGNGDSVSRRYFPYPHVHLPRMSHFM